MKADRRGTLGKLRDEDLVTHVTIKSNKEGRKREGRVCTAHQSHTSSKG